MDGLMHRVLVIDDDHAIHDSFEKILLNPEPRSSDRLEGLLAAFEDRPAPPPQGNKAFADSGSSLTLECAGDGQSGARMVEEGLHQGRPFSVAFVDMRMPTGWDGLATLKRLHAIDPALQTVICTAYADHSWDEIIEEIPDLDRLLVLKKPFDVIEVQQMTIALCRKWALARELDRSMSELRSERARLQGVIDNSDARICLKNRQGVFVLVNRQLAEAGGRSIEAMLGKDTEAVFSSEIAAAVDPYDQDVWERKEGLTRREPDPINPGRTILTSRFLLPATEETEPTLGTISVDVTEHLDLQARFRQRQRLDLVGMAAAGIVHDTNNLLTVVQAIATRSMRRLDQPDFIADQFRQLMDTSEQIAELLRRLLEFSRPQDEQRSFIDVNEMVPTDRKLYERLLGSRIELSLDLDAKIPLVLIDRLHLTQMLLNLLVNARDALPSEGGMIRLVARFQPYSERILLQVIDNGSGIPTESMDRLFEPFFTTKGEGGTGLGLSTVRTLARQHGGDVQVDSGSSGTTFSIFLPACGQVPAADDPTDDLINLRGLGEVVLVATTDRHYGEQISDMLLFQGYRVRLAISASAAHSIAGDLGPSSESNGDGIAALVLDPDEGVGLSADSLVGSVAPEAMLLLGASGQLPRRFRLVDLCDQLSMLISRR